MPGLPFVMTPLPPTSPSAASKPDQPSVAAGGTRAALLDAAEVLFSERGYGGVSTREIVDAAGANIAAIRYHFGSKEELYVEVLRRAMTRPESNELWAELPAAGTELDQAQAAERLARFVRSFLRHVIDEAASDTAPSLLCREAIEPSSAFGEVIEGYIKPRTAQVEHIVSVLSPNSDSDEVRTLGQAVFGMVLHYKSFYEIQARLWLGHEPDSKRVDRIASMLAAFSLRGLGCDQQIISAALTSLAADQEAL